MYKVSVVTPFHNVDMGMFEKCAESMRCQSIGFNNIEWIIVVHNCEPTYLPRLTEMFKNDSNVIIKELNDGMHTPATPRNHGMQFVTAPYMGFLDGDDSYTPDCLEVVRREMIETEAQVVTFRREYELEKESLHPHTEKVLWNQTKWRIVLDRKDFRQEEMFSGLWPFSTSRLFDVAFIRKHDLVFSTDVKWLEDVWHTGMCLMKAERVCYLPQFIGYHYFINSGSIIQDKKKPMEDLVDYDIHPADPVLPGIRPDRRRAAHAVRHGRALPEEAAQDDPVETALARGVLPELPLAAGGVEQSREPDGKSYAEGCTERVVGLDGDTAHQRSDRLWPSLPLRPDRDAD